MEPIQRCLHTAISRRQRRQKGQV